MINTFKTLNLKFALLLFSVNNLVNIHAQSAPMGTQFCSTATYPCSQSTTGLSSSAGCVDIPITVSGVGTLSLTNVLNSIKVNLGSSGCQANLTNYDFYIIAPDNTSLKFIDNITTNSTTGWVNTTFLDNANLERIDELPGGTPNVQGMSNPWSIGYYAIETDGTLSSTFNTKDANGTWIFRVCNGTTNTTVISINSICLTFGATVPTTNSPATNDLCANATCIDNTFLLNADNFASTTGDDPLFPADDNTSSAGDQWLGCTWNGGQHKNSWFKFTPTGTTAHIVLSGIKGGLSGDDNTQPLILSSNNGNACPTTTAGWTIPPGGCPDNAVNNTAYLVANGGGGTDYDRGITANHEFNLTGLTPNKTYYMLVDCNTDVNNSSFVVSMDTPGAGGGANGAISCTSPLPVEFLDFITTFENDKVLIYWSTASERNNNKFIVEKSIDHIKWISIDEVNGAGNSVQKQEYYAYDNEPNNGVNYYRIKQIDYDGKFNYSFVRTMKIENQLMISPNPNNGNFMLYGLNYKRENNIGVFNVYGQKIKELNTINADIEINLSEYDNGIYYLLINQSKILKFIKN